MSDSSTTVLGISSYGWAVVALLLMVLTILSLFKEER